MSSKAYDSELYDDLYGDGENTEYAVPLQDPEDDGDRDDKEKQYGSSSDATSPGPDSSSVPQSANKAAGHSLPAKPPSPGAAALSYSAQIARQFSAYQQTPSQERQQRAAIPLPPNPRGVAAAPAPIPSVISTHEAPGGRQNVDRPIRPSEMKDEGKMFVGGLNWDTTDEGLRKYFSEFGKVDACTIMRDPDGRSRGFAFLTFEEPSSVNAVMVREHYLDGKAIDPKRAIPREEHLRNTRYFLGGLSPSTTSESMREFFSVYGKVVDATVMVDRETGRSKGFGFVTFEDASNTDQLVGKQGLILDDKQIEVKTAQPRSQRDANRNANSGPNAREPFFNDRDSRTPTTPSAIPFPIQQQQAPNPMMYQRMMGQMPMMGANMPMMNSFQMGMPMGMPGFQAPGNMMMGGGMGHMGMGGMNGMGNMPFARPGPVGMGVGMGGGMGPGGMGASGMGMGMGMGMGGGAVNPSFGRTMNAAGPGPARMTNRGQHHFHPYAR